MEMVAEKSDDHYEVLGLERGCDFLSVRQGYLRKAKETHPDSGRGALLAMAGGARGRSSFLIVREAYEVLSNAERRRAYDAALLGRGRGIEHGAEEGRMYMDVLLSELGGEGRIECRCGDFYGVDLAAKCLDTSGSAVVECGSCSYYIRVRLDSSDQG